MCGIAGGFALRESGRIYLKNIHSALSCINHRGPDGSGIFEKGNIALGHKRLSIIDTSEAANQPMFSRDGRYCIIFNGEILNFKELQKKYFKDYHFTTTSDTEVMLELYIKKGADCFIELRGFFAAAIYDLHTEQLVIVRDRFGKKPVHLFISDEVLLFASELKSLMSFGIPCKLNFTSLQYYFQLNYLPQPLSILEGVEKLMPGEFLTISKHQLFRKQYYTQEVHTNKYRQYNYDQAKEKLVEILDKATRLRLMSDVPLGAFLSGGIDSSVIVALASKHQQRLKTFSIGYKDNPFFDETKYAKLVAKKYNTDHTVFSLGNEDFLEHIDDVLNAIDEPFADSSAIPTFILSKQTRKHVTVALSGDGGDEVFAGYNKYNAEWNVMQPSFKRSFAKALHPVWKILPKSRNNKVTNMFRQLNRFAEGASLAPGERYLRWASIMPGEESVKLLKHQSVRKLESGFSLNYKISGNDLNEVLLADMNLVLVGDMLVKVDMMSMANSLEVRSPFLDQEVVDFAFGLPAEYKINGGMKKRIVQDAFRDLLPVELYNRPKQGFDIPLLNWFKNDLWKRIDEDLLSDKFIIEQNIFNPDYISMLKKKLHSTNPEDTHETVWALIVFQHWWKKNINK